MFIEPERCRQEKAFLAKIKKSPKRAFLPRRHDSITHAYTTIVRQRKIHGINHANKLCTGKKDTSDTVCTNVQLISFDIKLIRHHQSGSKQKQPAIDQGYQV